ncbi:nitroreductase family protein [Heyndrickxia acidicola]|uniref:Nitroreductase family protein n=1 Tax=Heyndrickxia acidicola TaxID=209389 RepID=A0ABU6MIY8_9BACI|nr:nitroreductase family protein [Heyndrickxia acidicola]MED1204625.1 nitroreductase family protein [Heyndrickxia acidicola]
MDNEITSLAMEITERKSVVNWTLQTVSDEAWRLLLEAARQAPSSWNHQPARYILLKEKNRMKQLCSAFHRTNKWAEKAAGFVVQAANPDDDDRVSGKDYYLYDCGLAMMSLVYQAQIMGISCRQMIGWDEKEVKNLLQVPESYRIVVITAFGYPSSSVFSTGMEAAKRRLTQQDKRYKPEHIAFWHTWGGESFENC